MENKLRVLNEFRRITQWTSTVDVYYLSKNLEKTTLIDVLTMMKLNEVRMSIRRRQKGIAFAAKKENQEH